jgi:hypothetical protein
MDIIIDVLLFQIIGMQIPVILATIIFSYQVYRSLRISQFKLIFWGWILNFAYIVLQTFAIWDNKILISHKIMDIKT